MTQPSSPYLSVIKPFHHESQSEIHLPASKTSLEVIGLCGIAANLINICVFRRQGYQDGVNVTLTALAVSDIGALVSQQVYNILLIPVIQDYDLVILKGHLGVLVIYVNEYFVRVSGVVTSFASVERCLCVVLPLKVKTVITTKVAVIVNAAIFIVLSMYLFPPYFSIYLGVTYAPGAVNKTILSIFYQSYGESVLKMSYNFTDLLLPYGTFLVLIASSATIFAQLKSKAKWRKSISSRVSGPSDSASWRERRPVVMLMTVSVLCVLLVLPKSLMLTAGGVVREMKMDGAYKDITTIVYSFTTFLETINSSITVFVYYKMSTKFRSEFRKMFSCFGSKEMFI
ncbi:hypothetical protein Btru_056093 [Bulinus truncatus]|nr:hypothetical protein Btru_056093 [Bulinus truncatus]